MSDWYHFLATGFFFATVRQSVTYPEYVYKSTFCEIEFSCWCGKTDQHFRIIIKQDGYSNGTTITDGLTDLREVEQDIIRASGNGKPRCNDYLNNKEVICSKFRNCLRCENGGERCTQCPSGTYGPWCTKNTYPEYLRREKPSTTCEIPPAPKNGKIIEFLNSQYPVGSIIQYTCNYPYNLVGKETQVCLQNREWSGSTPSCQYHSTGAGGCRRPEEIPNGRIDRYILPSGKMVNRGEGTGQVFPIGTAAIFKCNNYYKLANRGQKYCRSTGEWTREDPKCSREKEGCPIPEEIPNIKIDRFILPDSRIVNQGSDTEQVFPIGTVAVYKCNNYYKLANRGQKYCRSAGKWIGEDPKCSIDCGISEFSKKPSIINGLITEPGYWPWQAGLANLNNFIFCGGSLITDKWVLTAAHCLYHERHRNQIRHPSEIKLFLGKYFRHLDDENVQQSRIDYFVVHPHYEYQTLENDIALLKLSNPVKITSHTLPICLTTDTLSPYNTEVGKGGIVTGWGETETGTVSNVLKRTNLTIISNTECEERFLKQGYHSKVPSNMFCAGVPKAASDICSGDSGGPMVFQNNVEGKPRWIQEGIVSWGPRQGCATDGLYSGFTKVVKFLHWIYMHVDLPQGS